MVITVLVVFVAVAALIAVGVHVGPHGSIVTASVGMVAGIVLTLMLSHSHSSLATILWSLVVLLFIGVIAVLLAGVRGLKSTQYNPQESVPGLLALLDSAGVATSRLDPVGTVQIAGKGWSARVDGDDPIEVGTTVFVTRVDGLKLHVIPEAPHEADRKEAL
jgi:membrane-bound ClpP family serine protease